MRHLPRALNRFLLFIGGLVLVGLGGGYIATSVSKPLYNTVHNALDTAEKWYTNLVNKSLVSINGIQPYSWMTIAWVGIAILIAVVALTWILRQGGGKTRHFELPASHSGEGDTIPMLSFVDSLLEDIIEEDSWVSTAKATAWEVKGKTGLAIDVNAYKGADPAHLKEVIDGAIARLDSVLGEKIPVRVHLTSNLRARFGSADRVK